MDRFKKWYVRHDTRRLLPNMNGSKQPKKLLGLQAKRLWTISEALELHQPVKFLQTLTSLNPLCAIGIKMVVHNFDTHQLETCS